MVKTTPLSEDTHKLLKDIQITLRERYDISMSIQDIVTHILPNREDSVRKIIKDIKTDDTAS
jgi:hypothetical protein